MTCVLICGQDHRRPPITDSPEKGPTGIVVFDLATGQTWRKLDDTASVKSEPGFVMFADGRSLYKTEPGQLVKPSAFANDSLAISADGGRIFYCPVSATKLYSIPTAALRDRNLSSDATAAQVSLVTGKESSDGLGSDADGSVYSTAPASSSILKISQNSKFANGIEVTTRIHDPRLLWPDTMSLSDDGYLYVTANQLYNQPSMHNGKDLQRKPYALFRIKVDAKPFDCNESCDYENQTFKTKLIKQAYEESGPEKGEAIFLVHGWPDSPRTWDEVLPALHEAEYKTIVPYLRGYGLSKFRDPLVGRNPKRTGQPVAFAQDLIELAGHLNMKRFHFIGHDWGARIGFVLSALFPERLKSHVAISVPFEPGKANAPAFLKLELSGTSGCSAPSRAKRNSAKIRWLTERRNGTRGSPAGWYTQAEFNEAAKSWKGEQFEDVVLHSYRSRWGHAPMDPAYAKQQRKLEAVETLDTPTLLIHGIEDACELIETTAEADRYFTGPYTRVLLQDVGHFPQREAAERVIHIVLAHFREHNQITST